MSFELRILPQAEEDLHETLSYLSEHSQEAAERWYQKWLACCETLRSAGQSFGRAPEDSLVEFTVHQFVFRSGKQRYRVLYRIVDDTVFVYHLRGPGRDWVGDFEQDLPELP